MVTFHPITLEDQRWMRELLEKQSRFSCEYCFGNHFIWRNTYQEQAARIGDYATVMLESKGVKRFLYPAGEGDLRPVVEELLRYAEEQRIPFRMFSASKEDVEELEMLFPGKFRFSCDRDFMDYIYRVEDLIQLPGRKYHGKRNHIARFRDSDWAFEELSDSNFQDCLEMNRRWCKQNGNCQQDDIRAERCAVAQSFRYFHELGFFGGLLRQDGRVVAYTIGEQLNEETVVVHIEKAFGEIQGAYPAINQEFLKNLCSGYTYVNREEDLGIPGLRRAKLSYHPVFLHEKYEVMLND